MLDAAIAEMVIGREFADPTALWDFVYDSQRGRGVNSGYWMDALAALDIAIWDAIGKRERRSSRNTMLDRETIRINIPVYLSGLDEERRWKNASRKQNHSRTKASKAQRSSNPATSEAAIQELDALISRRPATSSNGW